jgi:hypothetical protein
LTANTARHTPSRIHTLDIKLNHGNRSNATLAAAGRSAHRVWEVASGREIRDFVDPNDGVESVEFSRDARFVMTESYSKESQRIWNAATCTEVWRFENGTSEDGRLQLVAQSKTFIIVRDSATARQLYRFDNTRSDLSPDGRFKLVAENPVTKARIGAFCQHPGCPNSITMEGWLQYGADRVPTLYEEVLAGNVQKFTAHSKDTSIDEELSGGTSSLKKPNAFQQPSFFNFRKRRSAIVLSK